MQFVVLLLAYPLEPSQLVCLLAESYVVALCGGGGGADGDGCGGGGSGVAGGKSGVAGGGVDCRVCLLQLLLLLLLLLPLLLLSGDFFSLNLVDLS